MEDSELGSYGSLSESRSPQSATLPIDEISTKEQLKLCCKPSYKMRRVKTKGAILVLVWNFLAICVVWYLGNIEYRAYLPNDNGTAISLALLGFILPIAGWLADAYIGRYKMIYSSVWIMWVATSLETLSTVIEKLVDGYYYINAVVTQVLFGILGIGIGGFLSTIVQFGIDQLHDASTNEVSAFIMWYVCTCCGPLLIMDLSFYYFRWNNDYLILLGNLFLLTSLSLILILSFCCSSWLTKEPTTQNPFNLIYKVSRYAIKQKHLKYRSAFTYCEDEPIGRIDYGKVKYGGPFTTEQVEDVKTFYRVLPIIILCGLLGGILVAAGNLEVVLRYQFVIPRDAYSEVVNGLKKCYYYISALNIIPCSGALLIILYEVLIHPIFHRCFSRVTSLHKFIIGAILQILTMLTLMIFEILSQDAYLKESEHNVTVICVFFAQPLATAFNYNWIAIPDTFFVLSVVMMATGALEFISAQVPYSMKGIILGVGYFSIITTATFSIAIEIPFKQIQHEWGKGGRISCGFWYALLHLVLCIIGCVILVLITKWYKRRKREDVLPNEHFYAERYYSNLLEQNDA